MKKLKESNRLRLHEVNGEDKKMIKNVMKSLGVFRINSFDAQIILKDLIGMAEEMELRDSSLKEEIGEDLTGYVSELVENSRGSYFPELSADLIKKRVFHSLHRDGGIFDTQPCREPGRTSSSHHSLYLCPDVGRTLSGKACDGLLCGGGSSQKNSRHDFIRLFGPGCFLGVPL